MRYIEEFRDGKLAAKLEQDLVREAARLARAITLMEVCGTHTMSIYRHGLRSMFPENVKMVSGPGCPVCVTPVGYVDMAIELARTPGVIITTFGDMMRVPGTSSALQKERGAGKDVRVVYTALDALTVAANNKNNEVVFLGVGFETTAPSIASTIIMAKKLGITNFSVLCAHKVMPEPMEALTSGQLKLDGYMCPAHVSAIIGEEGYRPIAGKYGVPCVITGFEPLDILRGVIMLVRQVADGRAEVENEYNRVVLPEGNRKAQAILADVFVKSSAVWRGLGPIPDSGLAIAPKYEAYDAAKKFGIVEPPSRENPACVCGEILKGLKGPQDCPLFGKACVPENPIGACMVSSEGTCAAHYRYGAGALAHA
ncbi:MAG: hydrogenase formation protein HypD [Nitrospinae bacterium]|nr:hydrogenase formation protein HypD [Nitrospinota bacterium]